MSYGFVVSIHGGHGNCLVAVNVGRYRFGGQKSEVSRNAQAGETGALDAVGCWGGGGFACVDLADIISDIRMAISINP